MGLSVLTQVDQLFEKESNFDISGFIRPELVTVQLADRLGNLLPEERTEFFRHGYSFHWFTNDFRDGLIVKWIKTGKNAGHTLKLYFNPHFPRELAKGKDAQSQTEKGE